MYHVLIKVQPYICHSYLGCLKDSVEFALRCRVDLHIIDIQKMGDFPVYGLRWFVPFRGLQLPRYRIETQRKKPRAQSVTLWEPLVKVDDIPLSLVCNVLRKHVKVLGKHVNMRNNHLKYS